MKAHKIFRGVVVAWTCLGLAVPQTVRAGNSSATLQIPISKRIDDIALQADGRLQGAIVDANGRPIQDAPVVIGFNGKPIAQIRTDDQGHFSATGLAQGTYQVVSHGGAHHYRLWHQDAAPASAKQGVIHVANPNVARGAAMGPVMQFLSNPLFLGLLIAAAIAIPLAIDSNDAS